MAALPFARFFHPAGFRRRQLQEQVAWLRARDGDACARCRRPLRFDRPAGHDDAARVEAAGLATNDGLANMCLTHGRCNVAGRDLTGEALERLRPAREAELFGKGRGATGSRSLA